MGGLASTSTILPLTSPSSGGWLGCQGLQAYTRTLYYCAYTNACAVCVWQPTGEAGQVRDTCVTPDGRGGAGV